MGFWAPHPSPVTLNPSSDPKISQRPPREPQTFTVVPKILPNPRRNPLQGPSDLPRQSQNPLSPPKTPPGTPRNAPSPTWSRRTCNPPPGPRSRRRRCPRGLRPQSPSCPSSSSSWGVSPRPLAWLPSPLGIPGIGGLSGGFGGDLGEDLGEFRGFVGFREDLGGVLSRFWGFPPQPWPHFSRNRYFGWIWGDFGGT